MTTRLASSIFAALALAVTSASAQGINETPRELQGVDVEEHLDAQLPLDARFVDSTGAEVALGDYFQGDKPVILTLNYYNCPMLCTLILNGMVEGLRQIDLEPGEDYRIVTVSFDPDEGPDLAAPKKMIYERSFKDHEVGDGWAFLSGDQENITRLTETVGFGYKWNEQRNEWAHPSAIFVITPDGRVSRYLYGITFEPKNLRLALLEGSEGEIGSTFDKVLLWCFHYDDTTGQYTVAIMRIVRVMGLLTVLLLGGALFWLWRRDNARPADELAENHHHDVAGVHSS